MLLVHISELLVYEHADLCDQDYHDDIDCGQGICVDETARCDGFNDCLNWAEEQHCGKYDNTMIGLVGKT